MPDIDRRQLLGALAAGGGAVATTVAARAAPAELKLADLKKEAEVACLYHCDFGDDKRYDAMLRNINNHLAVYNFDPLGTKIVIVAHSVGIKYHLKDLAGTPWDATPDACDLAVQRVPGVVNGDLLRSLGRMEWLPGPDGAWRLSRREPLTAGARRRARGHRDG